MRRNSVRHFIHMVIDILPLLIIPIFALNILHKETEPISIEVQEKVSVDFNQQLNGFEINAGYQDYVTLNNPYSFTLNGTFNGRNTPILTSNKINMIANHIYYFKTNWNFNVHAMDWSVISDSPNNRRLTCTTSSVQKFSFDNLTSSSVTYNYETFYCDIFDLTQMYGSGNEPTESEFNSVFNNVFYEYTESQKMLVNKPTPTTYNSTDIGSQFVYALYKPVHDYFNFNNLFNMGAIYNWIELNLFSGTAQLPIFIIWNVIVYEFFVDLIFLLYSVFMFIIDFATQCVDRFTYKGRKGI